jgi:hypothetical protein
LAVGELAPLLAAVIAVEDEAAPVESLEQHHPDIGQPVGIDGRQRHRFGIGGLGLAGILEPGRKQSKRFLGLGEIARQRPLVFCRRGVGHRGKFSAAQPARLCISSSRS